MRFLLKEGHGSMAIADPTMLAAVGLPGGGVLRLGDTHVRVKPGDVRPVNTIIVSAAAMRNGAGTNGASVDGARAVVPIAASISTSGAGIAFRSALLGVPVEAGDTYTVNTEKVSVISVEPGPVALVGPSTRIVSDGEVVAGDRSTPREIDASAMIAGLEDELDLLTGWLRVLASDEAKDRQVAGLVVSAPPGCGTRELVQAAATAADLSMHPVDLRTVTTPDRLLAKLETALRTAPPAATILIDGIDPFIAQESNLRHQAAAVMRWFLDSVAERDSASCVVDTKLHDVARTLDAEALLPRTLRIGPPNVDRRTALFRAEIGDKPEIDVGRLANVSAGFSALDVTTAVLEAMATSNTMTTDSLLEAIGATEPSLGTTSLGDVPSYGFGKVANLSDVKRVLTESVIWPLTDPERFERMGIEPPRGILLHGPPGTGKTFVVRALAHESGAAFFSVKGAELLDKWVGESERGVREVFSRARTVAPAIIFFDELDALAPPRGSSTNNVTDTVVAALLTELDGVGERGNVFAIGATNRIDLIDPALLRPGRLGVHLLLDVPSPEARLAFLSMTSVPMADDVDFDEIVSATEGASFADLEGMLRSAAISSLRTDPHSTSVTRSELMRSLPHDPSRPDE
jgi:transitional endoplasmic reticulum ATPase